MVIKEFFRTREDGINLFISYSDQDFYIIKDGTSEKYENAVDIEGALYTYSETDEKIIKKGAD